ncbi:hypothetical protein MRX96_049155 [Rhipicephalus microplus]
MRLTSSPVRRQRDEISEAGDVISLAHTSQSSVRHALFQKWFVKVCPTSVCENVRHRSYFWGLNYYLRPREWVMPQREPRAFSSPVQVEAGHRGDDDEPRKNTAAPSALQLEPEREISPPESKKPLGRKRRQTAARGSSDCMPSVPQPSVEEQAGPSSTYPLPHMNLWKMEYMKMDAWPAASQVGGCTAAPVYLCGAQY